MTFLLHGCGEDTNEPPAGDGDADIDSDADADGDGDSDGDGDADPDADLVEGCAPAPGAGDFDCTLEHDGLARAYHLHVPATYDRRPEAGVPLVFDFHGFTSNGSEEPLLTGMVAKSEAEGFVVVHPEGTGDEPSWNAGSCCGTAITDGVDDVGFALAMLERIATALDVDASRVFTTGMSNGGYMSHRLGCERADVFASAASIAGLMGLDACAPSRPFSILQFHGREDHIVPYDGNGFAGGGPVVANLAAWAARNGCEETRTVTFAQGDVTCERWDGCDDGADVELCTIEGGGHNWPGGPEFPGAGHVTADISATDHAWDFFVAHPLGGH